MERKISAESKHMEPKWRAVVLLSGKSRDQRLAVAEESAVCRAGYQSRGNYAETSVPKLAWSSLEYGAKGQSGYVRGKPT